MTTNSHKLTVDVKFELSGMIFANPGPSVSTGTELFEMNQVVTGGSVSVVVKLETISTQS